MSEALQKQVNFQTAAEELRETIQAAFVKTISDEQWKSMIEGELRRFTSQVHHNHQPPSPSPLSTICQGVLKDLLKERLVAFLQPEALLDGKTLAQHIRGWLDENQDRLIKNALAGALEVAIVTAGGLALRELAGKMPDPSRPGYAMDGTWISR